MIGFLCNFIPHVAMVVLFGSDLGGDVPGWFAVSMGIAFFVYMVCDNCDGKQARRTKTSSPLGMLLDHGMDAVTTVVNNFLLQRLVGVGNSYICIFAMLITTMPFYFAMLE